MAFQTSVDQLPVLGIPGEVSDATPARDIPTLFAEVDSTAGGALEDSSLGILPGRLVVRGTANDQGRLPHALAANADAIIIAGVSAAAPQDLGPIDFDGKTNPDGIGPDRWPVPTIIDLVLSSSLDWDATTATLTGYDSTGALISEVLAIPDDGNATVSTTNRYVQVTRLQIDAQAGAGGTYTLGVQGPAGAVLSRELIKGIACNDMHREGAPDRNGIPSGSNGTPYVDTEDFACARLSYIFTETENQCTEGAPVWCRVVNTAPAGSPSNVGQLRSDSDAGNALRVPGALVRRVDGTIAELDINFRP